MLSYFAYSQAMTVVQILSALKLTFITFLEKKFIYMPTQVQFFFPLKIIYMKNLCAMVIFPHSFL